MYVRGFRTIAHHWITLFCDIYQFGTLKKILCLNNKPLRPKIKK